jgi:enoyl-CoA hydratase/carnithine racemase
MTVRTARAEVSQVQSKLDGAVQCIAINRPEKKNALTAEMYTALADALEQADIDPAVRVVLFHGMGDSFTAGNDLVDFLQKPWSGQQTPPAVRFIYAVASAQKPLVAAVQGVAVGIGLTMLLHCELVYAAEGARFIAPFVDLGIVPEAASTVLLPALAGHQRAAEFLMLGTPLDAPRAYELGLVNAIVPPDALFATALQAARKLAEKPLGALLACKRLMKLANQAAVDRALHEEVAEIKQRLDSPESREALTAFVEKRKPDFSKFR